MAPKAVAPATNGSFVSYHESMKEKPVYVILGPQGSGTNLLSKILRNTLQFSVVQDRSLIFNAASDLLPKPTPDQVRRKLHQVHSAMFAGPLRRRLISKSYSHQATNYVGIEEHFGKVDIRSATDFVDFFYNYHAFMKNAVHRGIKSDDIWERIEHLPQIIPNARFLFLVRDPRDNALSITKKNFGPRNLYCASLYVRKRLRIYQQAVERSPEHSMTIKYEDLLTRPHEALDMLAERFSIEKPADAHERLAAMAIRGSNFNKWKSFPRKQLMLSEAVLANELRQFGYEVATDAPSPGILTRTQCWSMDILGRIPQRVTGHIRHFINP